MPFNGPDGKDALYTVADAADILGVGRSAVRMAIRAGRLRASRLGARLLVITHDDLERYRQDAERRAWSGGRHQLPDDQVLPRSLYMRAYRARKKPQQEESAAQES